MAEIAQAGKLRRQGIPTTYVRWTDHGATPTERTAKVFSEISKTSGAGINYEQTDNNGEITGLYTGRYYVDLSFSCVLDGATVGAVLDASEFIPLPNDELTLDADGIGGTHPDGDIDGVAYVQSCSVRYTPDSDTVMDITARHYFTVSGTGVSTEVDLTA